MPNCATLTHHDNWLHTPYHIRSFLRHCKCTAQAGLARPLVTNYAAQVIRMASSSRQFHLPRFYVYLLFSQKTGQVYCGQTANLRQRLRQHNAADNSGWTKRGQPWRLLAVKTYLDPYSAQMSEQQLKRSRYDKVNWTRSLPRLKRLRQRAAIAEI